MPVPGHPEESAIRTKLLRVRMDGDGHVRRAVSGLVGIFYEGPMNENIDALKRHAAIILGPGCYRIVIETYRDPRWRYVTSTTTQI